MKDIENYIIEIVKKTGLSKRESLLFLLTFISLINIMSINWKPFPTIKLYHDYQEI